MLRNGAQEQEEQDHNVPIAPFLFTLTQLLKFVLQTSLFMTS